MLLVDYTKCLGRRHWGSGGGSTSYDFDETFSGSRKSSLEPSERYFLQVKWAPETLDR